ncbi:MAG: ATP-grasp domain-containing protein [Acidobacteriota bacterium]
MIVFSEATKERPLSKSAQDVHQLTELAKLTGCTVYYIPKDFSICETAENALWHIPTQAEPTDCFWIGYIPSMQRYSAIYTEAAKKHIKLLNSLDEHQKAQEFDYCYPLLAGLTPESISVSQLDECEEVVEKLALPLFVRGAVRSKKALGWKACVAETVAELKDIVKDLLGNQYCSRGRVIIRKLIDLRYSRTSDAGFPFGREYRVFLYKSAVVGYGYYWDGDDPLMDVSPSEEKLILTLAREAAQRLAVPFIAVDIGQLVDGDWIIIEVNDGQFAGTGHIDLLPFWNKLLTSVTQCR